MNNTGLRRFFRTWISDEGYLGIHLIAGFFIALFGALLFFEIADEVVESEDIRLLDHYGHRLAEIVFDQRWIEAMILITFFGELESLIVLSLLVGLILHRQGSHRRLYTFAAIMGGGGLLNALLKMIFARSRPDAEVFIQVHGYSFPSGHAMGAALFFGGLGYVLFFTGKRNLMLRLSGILFCASAAFLIGLSRIYLGVHYTSDVLAGFVGGITWTAICIFSTEAWIRWRRRTTHFAN